jgi:hypothetical protein
MSLWVFNCLIYICCLFFELLCFLADLLSVFFHILLEGLYVVANLVLISGQLRLRVKRSYALSVFPLSEIFVSICLEGQKVELLMLSTTLINHNRTVPISKVVLSIEDVADSKQFNRCDTCLSDTFGVALYFSKHLLTFVDSRFFVGLHFRRTLTLVGANDNLLNFLSEVLLTSIVLSVAS